MIITRTPFRMSFCGGGSDIPDFYLKHGGCVLSTSINKYMYISIHPFFDKDSIVLKYSKTEIVKDYSEIEHSYFAQMLKKFNLKGVEISSTADVPAGTGLGSSSSFTVGVLHTLYSYIGKFVSKERLASEACRLEIDELSQPIGKQDQYAAAYGGLNFYTFNQNGSVSVAPIIMHRDKISELSNNLLMFYTGNVRSASNILREQKDNISRQDKESKQVEICRLTHVLKEELENNNIDSLGAILHESWLLKKELANGISNPEIDDAYAQALSAGAVGGKLLGAGGGGFLLFYVPEKHQAAVKQRLSNLKEMPFGFDWQGSQVIYVGDKF